MGVGQLGRKYLEAYCRQYLLKCVLQNYHERVLFLAHRHLGDDLLRLQLQHLNLKQLMNK
jgi:hypothetical protein